MDHGDFKVEPGQDNGNCGGDVDSCIWLGCQNGPDAGDGVFKAFKPAV